MRNGFSLIELMVVLIIATILFVLVVPSQTLFFHHAKARAVDSQLLQALDLARTTAISRAMKVVLCKSADHKSCSGQGQAGYIVLANDEVIYDFSTDSTAGELYWRSALGHEYLAFLPDGMTQGGNGTFWYCAKPLNQTVWAIIINQAGRARQVFPNSVGEVHDAEGKALLCKK